MSRNALFKLAESGKSANWRGNEARGGRGYSADSANLPTGAAQVSKIGMCLHSSPKEVHMKTTLRELSFFTGRGGRLSVGVVTISPGIRIH